jgi:hypothetical protein
MVDTMSKVKWKRWRKGYYEATVNGVEVYVEDMRHVNGNREWAVGIDGVADDFALTMAEAKVAAIATARTRYL